MQSLHIIIIHADGLGNLAVLYAIIGQGDSGGFQALPIPFLIYTPNAGKGN